MQLLPHTIVVRQRSSLVEQSTGASLFGNVGTLTAIATLFLPQLFHDNHIDKMADFNWRTLNIDALDPESSYNFDLATLTPAVQPVSTQDVQTLSGQIKQLMRAGQAEEALKGALENPPYGADEQGKVGRTPLEPNTLKERTSNHQDNG
jgi:hypothetical protein